MDVDGVKRRYRLSVWLFELPEGPLRRFRATAVMRLGLAPGDSVLDLGCGTGLSFALLEAAVGTEGRITGVDVSPEMMARARSRVAHAGWTNVTLVEANAEEADLPRQSFDAVLCFYTHDVLTSARAVERAVAALVAGGRFVAAGGKLADTFPGVLLNPLVAAYAVPFVTNFRGGSRPWTVLERHLGPLDVEQRLLGTAYLARGVKPVLSSGATASPDPEDCPG